jgi:hypothetical protein
MAKSGVPILIVHGKQDFLVWAFKIK